MTYSLTPAIVAPIIGVVLSVTRSLVPIREVVSIRANRRLGVRLLRSLKHCPAHSCLRIGIVI